VFVSIVLNHVSEYDDSVFYKVVDCLELLLSNLGKTDSAGFMRKITHRNIIFAYIYNLEYLPTSLYCSRLYLV
jgi:hypothetical protein